MSLASLMFHSCNVETQAQTKTPTGGASVAWVAKATGLRCNVQPLDAEAMVKYGREGLQVTHTVYFNADPSLTVSDRIVFAGGYYEVKAGPMNAVHLNRLWEVVVRKMP